MDATTSRYGRLQFCNLFQKSMPQTHETPRPMIDRRDKDDSDDDVNDELFDLRAMVLGCWNPKFSSTTFFSLRPLFYWTPHLFVN